MYLHFLLYIRIAVVQVWLLFIELMVIILPSLLIVGPSRPIEHADPVIRWLAFCSSIFYDRISPYVIICIFSSAIYAQLEPLMFVWSVVRNEIQNKLKIKKRMFQIKNSWSRKRMQMIVYYHISFTYFNFTGHFSPIPLFSSCSLPARAP